MPINFNRSRRVWHGQIARWGQGVNNGKLVRSGTERIATMAMVEYTPRERGLFLDGAVRFWVSALLVTGGVLSDVPPEGVPDETLDVVLFHGVTYKILLPPAGQQPDSTWIAFDLNCMRT